MYSSQGNHSTNLMLLWPVLAVAGVAGILGALFGAAASTGVWILPVLLLGLVLGAMLIFQPLAMLWIVMVLALVISGVAKYFFSLGQLEWAIYALACGLWAGVVAYRLRPASGVNDGQTPGFIWIFWAFLALGIISSAVNWHGIPTFLVGIKNYVLLFGVVIALAYIPFPAASLRKLYYGLVAIALVQFPVELYQYFVVRPARIKTGGLGAGGVGDSIVEASDSVSGTLGGLMLGGGGGTSLLPILLVCVISFFIVMWMERRLSTGKAVLLIIPLLISSLLTESKSVFVFMPVAMLVIGMHYYQTRKAMVLGLATGFGLFLIAGLLAYQSLHWSSRGDDLWTNVQKQFSYSFQSDIGSERAQRGDMTRFQALQYWAENHGIKDPVGTVFGHGLSSSKSSSYVSVGPMVVKHMGRQLDKTALSQLLWDIGLAGLILFILMLFSAYRGMRRLLSLGTLSGNEKVIILSLRAALAIIFVSLPYTGATMNTAAGQFLFCIAVGLSTAYQKLNLGSR